MPDACAASNGDLSSDSPINDPAHDTYGISGFAKALAGSIARVNASDGLVLAVNGPWGSGKSSACNLILHYLGDDVRAERIVPVTFNPWWFSGAHALTLSFFQELGASVGKSLTNEGREALSSLGARLSSAGPVIGALLSFFATPAAGAAAAAGAAYAGKLTKLERTIEQEHKKLATALRAQQKKFLVVIDDIDRLGTDEALEIFRLIKSVGRLPNIVYLLAFDRLAAERMINQRFPAEGPSYLDKFIQGGFDLPPPDPDDLRDVVLRSVEDVMGSPSQEKLTRFLNLFYDICAPLIRLPRDAIRLANAIKVSWPAVADEVDPADFIALEALRLFLPTLHAAVRANPAMLCGRASDHQGREWVEEYNAALLHDVPAGKRQIAQSALMRLFPRTESIWSNVHHNDEEGWQRDRLVCAATHFSTYFALSVPEGAITAEQFARALEAIADTHGAEHLFRDLVSRPRRRGGTRAALMLEELTARSAEIPDQHIPPLLAALFTVADEIDVEADEARGFGVGDNPLRIHWLLNNLVRDRFDQARRGELIEAASQNASIGWLLDICRRCNRDYGPADPNREQREPLVPQDVAARLCAVAARRAEEAAADGTLIGHRSLIRLLFAWAERTSDALVRAWTDQQLYSDEFVLALAARAVRTSWSQGIGLVGLGDRVATRHDYVDLRPLAPLLDIQRFEQRVGQLLDGQEVSPERRATLERFRDAPREHDV